MSRRLSEKPRLVLEPSCSGGDFAEALAEDRIFIDGGYGESIYICDAHHFPEQLAKVPIYPDDHVGYCNGCCTASPGFLAISPGGSPYSIPILNLSTLKIDRYCAGHTERGCKMREISSPTYSCRSSGIFASGAEDGTIRLWDSDTAEQLEVFKIQGEGQFRRTTVASRLEFSVFSGRIYAGTLQGRLISWSVEDGSDLGLVVPEDARGAICAVGLDSESETLYVCPSGSKKVLVYDPSSHSASDSHLKAPVSEVVLPDTTTYIGDIFYHAGSMGLVVQHNGHITIVDCRMLSVLRTFKSQRRNSFSRSDLAQLNENTFLSQNGSSEMSQFQIDGTVLGHRSIGHTFHFVYSPYLWNRERGELMGTGDGELEEDQFDFLVLHCVCETVELSGFGCGKIMRLPGWSIVLQS